MNDPWILDGKLRPAAEWMGLPEWEHADGDALRLTYEKGCGWRAEGEDFFYYCISPHEAAALLEKDKREKLAEHRISVYLDSEHDWVVYRADTNQWLQVDGTWGKYEGTEGFRPYDAALQAACIAAKGEDDGKSTDADK